MSLRHLREAAGLSIEELARKSATGVTLIAEAERGVPPDNFWTGFWVALADTLSRRLRRHVSIDELMGREAEQRQTTDTQALRQRIQRLRSELELARLERDEARDEVAMILGEHHRENERANVNSIDADGYRDGILAVLEKLGVEPDKKDGPELVDAALDALMSALSLSTPALSEPMCAGCGGDYMDHCAPDQGGCSGCFPDWYLTLKRDALATQRALSTIAREFGDADGEWTPEQIVNTVKGIASVQARDTDALERLRETIDSVCENYVPQDIIDAGDYEEMVRALQRSADAPADAFEELQSEIGQLKSQQNTLIKTILSAADPHVSSDLLDSGDHVGIVQELAYLAGERDKLEGERDTARSELEQVSKARDEYARQVNDLIEKVGAAAKAGFESVFPGERFGIPKDVVKKVELLGKMANERIVEQSKRRHEIEECISELDRTLAEACDFLPIANVDQFTPLDRVRELASERRRLARQVEERELSAYARENAELQERIRELEARPGFVRELSDEEIDSIVSQARAEHQGDKPYAHVYQTEGIRKGIRACIKAATRLPEGAVRWTLTGRWLADRIIGTSGLPLVQTMESRPVGGGLFDVHCVAVPKGGE